MQAHGRLREIQFLRERGNIPVQAQLDSRIHKTPPRGRLVLLLVAEFPAGYREGSNSYGIVSLN